MEEEEEDVYSASADDSSPTPEPRDLPDAVSQRLYGGRPQSNHLPPLPASPTRLSESAASSMHSHSIPPARSSLEGLVFDSNDAEDADIDGGLMESLDYGDSVLDIFQDGNDTSTSITTNALPTQALRHPPPSPTANEPLSMLKSSSSSSSGNKPLRTPPVFRRAAHNYGTDGNSHHNNYHGDNHSTPRTRTTSKNEPKSDTTKQVNAKHKATPQVTSTRDQLQKPSQASPSSSSSSMENTSDFYSRPPVREVRLDNEDDTAFEDGTVDQRIQNINLHQQSSMAETTLEGSGIVASASNVDDETYPPARARAKSEKLKSKSAASKPAGSESHAPASDSAHASSSLQDKLELIEDARKVKKELKRSNQMIRSIEREKKEQAKEHDRIIREVNEQHQAELLKMSNELESVKAKRDEFRGLYKQSAGAARKASKDSDNTMRIRLHYESRCEKLDAKVLELKQQLSESNEANRELRASVEQLVKEKRFMEKENSDLTARLERAWQEHDHTQELEQLQKDLAAKEERNQQLTGDVNKLERQLEAANRANVVETREIQADLSETRTELERAHETMHDLTRQLGEANNRIQVLEAEQLSSRHRSSQRSSSSSTRGSATETRQPPEHSARSRADHVDPYNTASMEPSLAERINRLRESGERLELVKAHQLAMRQLQVVHDSDMKKLKAQHEEEVRNLEANAEIELDSRLHQQSKELKKEHSEKMNRIVSNLQRVNLEAEANARENLSLVNEKMVSLEQQLSDCERRFEDEQGRRILCEKNIAQLKKLHEAEKRELQADHKREMEEVLAKLSQDHSTEISEIKNELNNVFQARGIDTSRGRSERTTPHSTAPIPAPVPAPPPAPTVTSRSTRRVSPNSIRSTATFLPDRLVVDTRLSSDRSVTPLTRESGHSRSQRRMAEIAKRQAEVNRMMQTWE